MSEVFLTGIRASSDSSFTVTAQWPRWHVFYNCRGDQFDSALVIETLRQLTVLVAHSQLGVSFNTQFLMPEMDISIVPNAYSDPSHPAEITADVTVSEIRRTANGVSAFRSTAIFTSGGDEVARGTATARIVGAAAYDRIRTRRRNGVGATQILPVDAGRAGCTSVLNVVLGEAELPCAWPLRVDVTNPILFDHPLDHIPGVLLMEAVRQTVRLAIKDPKLDFSSFKGEFLAIAELGDSTLVVLEDLFLGTESLTAHLRIQAGSSVLMRAVASAVRKGAPIAAQARRTLAELVPVRPLHTPHA